MDKITAIITDDEPNARMALSNMVQLYCKQVEVIAQTGNMTEALAAIDKLKPELLFLDIQMPGGSGFDLIKRLKKPAPQIIFVTAHEQFALKAFKMSALDYLLKPVSPKELVTAVEKAIESKTYKEQLSQKLETMVANHHTTNDGEKKIILNTTTEMFVIKTRQIIRCEADENYSRVFLSDGKSIFISRSLKELDELLSPFGFSRIHQSHLINLDHVCKFDKRTGGVIELSNGDKVPLAGRRKDYFFALLKKYF